MHWFLHWTSFFIIYHSLISTCCTSPRDMHWFLHWTSFFIIHHSLLSTCCTSPRDMHWFLRWDTFSIRFGFEPILQQRIKVTPQPLIKLCFSKFSQLKSCFHRTSIRSLPLKSFQIFVDRTITHQNKSPPSRLHIHTHAKIDILGDYWN